MDKKQLYELMTDIWHLIKKYADVSFADDTWEKLRNDADAISEVKYKNAPHGIDALARYMVVDVLKFFKNDRR